MSTLPEDISVETDRNQAEDALRRNAEAFAALVEQAPLGIYTVDSRFRIRNVSVGAMPAFRNVEPLIGRDFGEVMRILWPESFASEAIRIFRHTLETGEPYVSPGLTEKRNDLGAIESYEWQINRLMLADGQYGVVCYYFDTTRLQQAHQAVRESEERIRLAQQVARVGSFEWNIQQRVSEWSPELEMLHGLPPGGFDGTYEAWAAMVHPEDLPKAERTHDEALETGLLEGEWRVVWPDGNIRWVAARGQVFKDGMGRPLRMVGVNLDITPSKKAEEALRQQRERYEFVAEGSDVGFWFCDVPLKDIIWDKRVKNHFWLPPDDRVLTFDEFYAMLHPDDREPTRRAVENSLNNKELYDVEYRTMSPDGRYKWIRAVGRTFYDESGTPIRFDGITQDVTERKQAQESLRQQQERAEFVADASDVGFWFCDLPFDKLIWDKRVKDHFWLPPDADVTIHTFYERLHPEDREPTRRAIEGSIAGNTKYDIEYRTVALDGRQNWIRAIGRTFYDGTGQPTRFDGITMNVTDRKKSDLALSASETRYRELAENLDRQVQARTVELQARNREILRTYESLRTLSTRMMSVQDEERRRIARDLHDSAGQLLVVIDMQLNSLAQDLRQMAPQLNERLEETEGVVKQLQTEIRTTSYLLHPPLLDEAGLYSALNWYVEGLNKRGNVQIALEIAPDFGRLPRDIELVVFRLVQESLANIYRHSGSKTGSICIARDDGTITVEVQDRGKGVPPGKLVEIQSEGSGVGIRGMRERLRQYGGELRIESEREKGTRVWVTIPISPTSIRDEKSRLETKKKTV